MKAKITLSFLFIGAILALILCSCNLGQTTIKPSKDNVKLIGRTHLASDKNIWCSYSGSGIEFEFKGTECSVKLLSDNVVNNTFARIGVFVNDEMVQDIHMNDDRRRSKTVDIIKESKETECTIKLIKLTEGQYSTVGFENIVYKGRIHPAAEKEFKIEFVGDSLATGYGVEAKPQDKDFNSSMENVTKAFPCKAAKQLNADYSIVAASEIGVCSGYSDTPKETDKIMELSYLNHGVSDSFFPENKRPQDCNWDFSQFVPNLVVINLGMNDTNFINNDLFRQQEFILEYIDLIRMIRKNNEKAYILCTYGPMDSNQYPLIETAVEKYVKEKHDENISCYCFEMQSEKGFEGHPTENGHQKMADELTKLVLPLQQDYPK